MSSSEDESGINWANIETIKSFDGSKFKKKNISLIREVSIKKKLFQLNPIQISMEIQQNFKKVQ